MKITLNGKVSDQVVSSMLAEQERKKQNIIEFCKSHKIDDLSYKDSELEFEYHKKVEKEFATPKVKAETRGGAKNVKG